MHVCAMNIQDPNETHSRRILACLGVASRFRLVRVLSESDRCVGELAVEVGLSQSCTTRHLQALEQVGLVKGHREGRRVRFRLRADAPGLGALLGWALSAEGGEPDLLRDGALTGGDPHRDRGGSRSRASAEGDPGKRPPRRAPANHGSEPSVESIQSAGPPPVPHGGTDDPGPGGNRRAGSSGAPPAGRSGDLEDYLL